MDIIKILDHTFVDGKDIQGGIQDPINHENFVKFQVRSTEDPNTYLVPIIVGTAYGTMTREGRDQNRLNLAHSSLIKLHGVLDLALEVMADDKDLGGIEIRAGQFHQVSREEPQVLSPRESELYGLYDWYLKECLGFIQETDGTYSANAARLYKRVLNLDDVKIKTVGEILGVEDNPMRQVGN